MIDDDGTSPAPMHTGHGRVSTLDQLAHIPEEEIWLQKHKSARTRRAYRFDVQPFMRALSIATPSELRQADHKAVIAWSAICARSSTPHRRRCRRLAALSSLYMHLVRHDHAARNPVGEVERPAINRDEGATAAFSKVQARKLLVAETRRGEEGTGSALIAAADGRGMYRREDDNSQIVTTDESKETW